MVPALTGSTRPRNHLKEATSGTGGRYIDFGVRILVVAKSTCGAVPPGTELPAVAQVRDPVFYGGKYDTFTGQFVGPCNRWRTWLVGEKQFQILTSPPTQHNLLYSAEGAGKTVLMSMWVWLQIILAASAGIGGNLGATAPTATRLGTFIKGVCDLAPVGESRSHIDGEWGYLKVADGDIVCHTGHVIQFRSTKQQSEAQGSPIQGWNWGLGAGCDELQDSINAFADIVARLRAGKDAPIFSTATAKDSPAWRNFRDTLSDKYWTVHRINYKDTPFVHDSHWEMMKENMSPREWQRRGLAMDVGPERMVYTTWDREQNLRPVPMVGARDVTAQVLSRFGPQNTVLVGHDPGRLQDVSLILKAYQEPGQVEPSWFVVDEVTTEQTTTEEHCKALLERLRGRWGCNELDYRSRSAGGPKAHVRIDPFGDSDNKTDRSVYQTFKHFGLDARSAAYKNGTGKGRVPKEAGIEMVCRLLCNANGNRRLFIATDDRGMPVAKNLVRAIELSERDTDGKAETQRKGKADLSHWPAALRYALWPLERRSKSFAVVETEEFFS